MAKKKKEVKPTVIEATETVLTKDGGTATFPNGITFTWKRKDSDND